MFTIYLRCYTVIFAIFILCWIIYFFPAFHSELPSQFRPPVLALNHGFHLEQKIQKIQISKDKNLFRVDDATILLHDPVESVPDTVIIDTSAGILHQTGPEAEFQGMESSGSCNIFMDLWKLKDITDC